MRFPRTTALLLLVLFALPALAASERSPHQPMLASVYRADVPVTEYWVSEKLDGVRGHWDGRSLWTRGGYRIHTPDWFTEGWPDVPLDGELWIARDRFDEVSAIVRSTTGDEASWRQVRFMVFDLPAHPGTFEQRLVEMRRFLAVNQPWLGMVDQFKVADRKQLDRRLNEVVIAGGEGLMLHHRDSLYHAGRSQHLLKYKTYDDAEARVVGYTQGKGKYAGQVGALIVEDDAGRRFRLGSGLSDALRQTPPELGTLVTYRYNGLTANGLPRFARYLRVRSDIDQAHQPQSEP